MTINAEYQKNKRTDQEKETYYRGGTLTGPVEILQEVEQKLNKLRSLPKSSLVRDEFKQLVESTRTKLKMLEKLAQKKTQDRAILPDKAQTLMNTDQLDTIENRNKKAKIERLPGLNKLKEATQRVKEMLARPHKPFTKEDIGVFLTKGSYMNTTSAPAYQAAHHFKDILLVDYSIDILKQDLISPQALRIWKDYSSNPSQLFGASLKNCPAGDEQLKRLMTPFLMVDYSWDVLKSLAETIKIARELLSN